MPDRDPARSALARRIYDASYLEGSFVLRSGAVSSAYFDKYLFESDPVLIGDIAAALAVHVPTDVDALAGLETGGIPLAVMLSQQTDLPTRFVRKEAKSYGTMRLAEGGPIEGRKLLVVEDVVTSGGQILQSAFDLRQRGAIVERAVCVIDRQAGGAARLADEGIELAALFTMGELERAAAER